jgi:hypothetical protein
LNNVSLISWNYIISISQPKSNVIVYYVLVEWKVELLASLQHHLYFNIWLVTSLHVYLDVLSGWLYFELRMYTWNTVNGTIVVYRTVLIRSLSIFEVRSLRIWIHSIIIFMVCYYFWDSISLFYYILYIFVSFKNTIHFHSSCEVK